MIGVAFVLGATQHAALPGGLWTDRARRDATIELATLPSVSVQEARALREAGTAIIVDARPVGESTTLPASTISIPIGLVMRDDFLRAAIEGLPTDRLLLVHCGDSRCGQSRVVAAALRRLGRADVRVIRGAP